jgi:hypothetical protein
MGQANSGTWRVIDEAGETHEVALRTRRNGWLADGVDDDGASYWSTQRLAVLQLALERQWLIAEVLEPGERSRSELAAENAALLNAAREYIRCAGSACPSCGGRGMVPAGYAIEGACEECVARDNLATLAGCQE